MTDVMPEQAAGLDDVAGDELAGTGDVHAVDEQLVTARPRAGGLQLTGEGRAPY